MTYTPQSLRDLRAAFIGWTGCPTENFSMARGCPSGRGFRGYHIGQDQIFGSQGSCTGQRWEPEVQPVTIDEIKQLQSLLNSLGAAPALVVDGLFGPKTRAALVAALTTTPELVLDLTRQKTAIGEAIKALEAVR